MLKSRKIKKTLNASEKHFIRLLLDTPDYFSLLMVRSHSKFVNTCITGKQLE